jgi:transcriptional regulator with XRE-family HTH domain
MSENRKSEGGSKMSEFTAKKLKEARMKAEITQDEAAALMNVTRRAISEMEAGKRSISADELAQFSRIYSVDVRELLFVDFTAEGEEQRLAAKYSSFFKLLEKLSDREVEDVFWVIKRRVDGLL